MRTPPNGSKWFRAAALSLIAILLAVQIRSIRLENQTWDEGMELAAGFSYWSTGDFRMNIEHPILGKLLAALPLLWLHPDTRLDADSWKESNETNYGADFLYHNRVPADRLLLAGRSVTIVVTALLALAMAWWTRRNFGAPAALIALLLFCFDPNVIANGRYVKNDLLLALVAFLAVMAWAAGRHWTAGILLGLALATKYSAVFLIVVFLLLTLLAVWRRTPWTRAAAALGIVLAAAAMIVVAIYAPEAKNLVPMSRAQHLAAGPVRLLRTEIETQTLIGRAIAWVSLKLGWRYHTWLAGFARFANHARQGHPSYLFGRHSQTGWWYYFPAAFAVKTPVATLASLVLAMAIAMHRLLRRRARPVWQQLRSARIEHFALTVPLAVYGLFCLTAHVDIGVRHLLPMYPFLFVFAGVWISRLPGRAATVLPAVLAILLASESLAVYPDYLAFFNWFAGGPKHGPEYLADSNIDWGQDVKKLKAYLDREHLPLGCVSYFGQADLSYYGIAARDLLPETYSDAYSRCGVVAISVTPLVGLYVPGDPYAGLRQREPRARIGYSIYVYDLRR